MLHPLDNGTYSLVTDDGAAPGALRREAVSGMVELSPEEVLARALLDDAQAHESGHYGEIGERYDDVQADLLPVQGLRERRFAIAFNFWDGWADARNHDWNYYPGIGQNDWPMLARQVVAGLRTGTDPSEVVLTHFAPENLRPLRVLLWERLTRRLHKRADER